MNVLACRIRPNWHFAPTAAKTLSLVSGLGISGDVHAHVHSSRQVLIVGADAYARLIIPPGALKENIVVDGGIDLWESGDALVIGDAIVRLTFRCEPCRKLERVRIGLMREASGRRGFLGRVVRGGMVGEGSSVSLVKRQLAPMSDKVQERLAAIVNHAAPTETLSAGDLLRAAGAPPGYARALPSILRSIGVDDGRVLFGSAAQPLSQAWDPCAFFADGRHCGVAAIDGSQATLFASGNAIT